MNEQGSHYVGYEYLETTANQRAESLYVDSYLSFGWQFDGRSVPEGRADRVTLKFKRDRKLRNKAELTRLQRKFEADLHEIETLERDKFRTAAIVAITIGLIGTSLLAGAMFAYLYAMLPLMAVLAVPGFLGWLLPYFCYRHLLRVRGERIKPLIEQKQDEIDTVCEQASHLLRV